MPIFPSRNSAADAEMALALATAALAKVSSYQDKLVEAIISIADAPGGLTTAALTLGLRRALDGTTPIATPRVVAIRAFGPLQFGAAIDTSPTFGTATIGTILQASGGYCLLETNSAGEFACTVTNTTDETLGFCAVSAPSGFPDTSKCCVVVGSNNDTATWSP